MPLCRHDRQLSGSISRKQAREHRLSSCTEFAADYTNWEPQMRYFSRGHRCIAYSARGYTPLGSAVGGRDAYTLQNSFITDALAVLDHLKNSESAFRWPVEWAPIRLCRSA